MLDISFFFFFQAEDGIRDFHVTGVQTCALPIWAERGDAPLLLEQLAQALVERLGGAARDRVLRADRAALLDHLARRVDPLDPREPWAREPPAEICDLLLEAHVTPPGRRPG